MRGTTKRHIGRKLGSLFLCFAMLLSLVVLPVQAVTVGNDYTPGTYTGTAEGYAGEVSVTVTLAAGEDGGIAISDIQATGEKESAGQWSSALAVLDEIKKNNGTDGVDTVSGATKSSKGIIDATNVALAKANPSLSGNGTERDPYVVQTADQLAAFAAAVDNGNTYEGKYVVLGDDIDLSGIESWDPIGAESGTTLFQGTFDGKGYTIRDLSIETKATSGDSYHGLFAVLGEKAVVKDLNLINADVSVENSSGKVRVGVLAGSTTKVGVSPAGHANIGTRIDAVSATGSISAVSSADQMVYAGGIAGSGEIGTTITNCWTDVDVTAIAKAVSNKNSMAGGIIGNSGNFAVIANCATFGDVYAASPSATNYGGVAGGIVGMMAGKQYNTYATGDMTVGNGGLAKAHVWVGALDGQVTTSGVSKDDAGNYTVYPEQGPTRHYNYYANDVTLKMDVFTNNGSDLGGTKTIDTVDRGYSANQNTDKAMVSFAMTKTEMADEAFAETLNGNIKEINGILAAYGITGLALREWQVEDGKVLPTGDVWVTGEIDANIFASGDGSEKNPYLITNETQLRAFAGSMNNKIDYTGKYVALGANIEVSADKAWTPIGGSDYLFNGTFDGQGHTISGMTLGTAEKSFALDSENLYIGLFGVLGPKSVVKDVHLKDVAFYTSYEATAYVGGIAGVTQGSTTKNDYTGAVIDGCSVAGTLSLTAAKGNQFVGGLVGMQYKGAIINSSATVNASGVVRAGDLAEVGGLVGLNNRGLVANCWSDSTIYGSGNRDNGNEGMAVVSNLIACNAGALVNCYGSGDVTTKEHSTYAGMVSGWVTGIGKSYTCWYNLDSTMTVGKDTNSPLIVNPVESIGTKVASGVTEEGDAYTGGLVDKMTGYSGTSKLADDLNGTFAAFPIDIKTFGLEATALKNWTTDESGRVTFGETSGTVTYVQPDCEKVEKPEQKLQDGTWYGRDSEKKTVVAITVKDSKIVETKVLSGAEAGGFQEALAKAEYKAIYGDFSHYDAADPSQFAGGSGTQSDPYLISNEGQLRYLATSINADVDWSGVWFKQTADIKLTGGDWLPIGWALNGDVNGKKTAIAAYPFRGNYDGDGHTISGLTIGTEENPADQMASGLFGLTSGAYSSNDAPSGDEQVVRLTGIHLRDISIHVATRYETFTGGLVGSGQNGIYIDDCSVTGEISATTSESFARAGGLAASVLRGAVTNSWADVDIKAATDTNNVYAGGLYGMDNRVTTVNCYALGDVTGNSTNNNKVHIGGLAGQAGGIHVNCYAAGDVVSLKTTTDVGILSGRSAGIDIDYHCYYNTEATLKQGDTAISPAAAVGVVTTNAVQEDVTGKTAAELKSADFAALLNGNITKTALSDAMKAINDILAEPGSGLSQANYYQGHALAPWLVDADGDDAIVTLGAVPAQPSCGSSGGGGGGSTGTTTPTTPTTPSGLPFTDVKTGDWSYDSVRYVYEKGMMTGTAADKFSPNATVTRAMLVTILHRLEGAPAAAASSFTDVPAGQWYTDAVAWAAANGIVATTFAPNDPVTREQFAAILYRYAVYKGMDAVTLAEELGRFTDRDACSAYAVPALEWAVHEGLINGMTDTTLAPKGSATRAQAAAILARFCESDILK